MIDLHIHTINSDGTDDVVTILKKAEALKLEYISITDHETMGAYEELERINISDYYSGKIIKGIELKNYYRGHIIDILGYNVDKKIMDTYLEENFKNKTHAMLEIKYLKIFYEKAKKLGLKLIPFEDVDWNPNNEWASVIFYREMKRFEENKEKLPVDLWNNDFFNFKFKYTYNPKSLFYNDKSGDYPTPKQTIDAIHKAGGKAFIAHTYEYKWVEDKIGFWKDIMSTTDVDGLECFYSNFTDEQNKMIVDFCKVNNLYMSGGSDYHGKNKPYIDLGIGRGSLKVKKDILEWI